ncbi:MAG TPA: Rap1a/Tai family immunity protein [Kiloniellales bacterium]
MRTLCALVMLVAASTSAMAGAYEKWNSNLMINQLAEICDPTEAGAAQLYCTYYMMGLVDGLVISSIGQAYAPHCVPEGTSSQTVRRAVYERIAAWSASRKPAATGVAAALSAAFPCP